MTANTHFTSTSALNTAPQGAVVVTAEGTQSVAIPLSDFLLDADFHRAGPDLVLTGNDGREVIVTGYFAQPHPPALVAPGGATIQPDLAAMLAGPVAPGQFAQAGAAGQHMMVVGKVTKLSGTVEVVHPDGSRGTLQAGDLIHKGDVIATKDDGSIGITFADNSSFALGKAGRMVIDELVYDPGAQTGQSALSVVKGTFSFVSGQIAKSAPDAATIKTPVMTIGIRGTSVAGTAGAEGEENTITLLTDFDGTVGQVTVTNGAGTVTLNQSNFTIRLNSFIQPPPPPVYSSAQQIRDIYQAVLDNHAPQSQPQPSNQPPPTNSNPGFPGGDGNGPANTNTNAPAPPPNSNGGNNGPVNTGGDNHDSSSGRISAPEPPPLPVPPAPITLPPIPPVIPVRQPPVDNKNNNNNNNNNNTNTEHGNGSGGSSGTNQTPNGRAIDGYVSGAFVFRDLNNNGAMDANEVSTTTNASGQYYLSGSGGVIVVVGGTDTTTRYALPFVMKAATGSSVVTPLTTLVVAVTGANLSAEAVAAAEAQVKAMLGLSWVTSSLGGLDPIANIAGSEGKAVLTATVQTVATINALSKAFGGSIGADAILAKMAAFAASGTTLDLTSADSLSAFITAVNGNVAPSWLSLVANSLSTVNSSLASAIGSSSSYDAIMAQVADATSPAGSISQVIGNLTTNAWDLTDMAVVKSHLAALKAVGITSFSVTRGSATLTAAEAADLDLTLGGTAAATVSDSGDHFAAYAARLPTGLTSYLMTSNPTASLTLDQAGKLIGMVTLAGGYTFTLAGTGGSADTLSLETLFSAGKGWQFDYLVRDGDNLKLVLSDAAGNLNQVVVPGHFAGTPLEYLTDGDEYARLTTDAIGTAGDDFIVARDLGGATGHWGADTANDMGEDEFFYGGGANVFHGNGDDRLNFGAATSPFIMSGAVDGDGDGQGVIAGRTQSFTGIRQITGTQGDDVLYGRAAGTDGSFLWLAGGKGNDVLHDGGGQSTVADYRNAKGSVSINLAAGTATGADGNDVLDGIVNAAGSAFDDVIIGSGGSNWLDGGDGNDIIDGGDGFDIVSYDDDESGVSVNLAAHVAMQGHGRDALANVEGVAGSDYSDTLIGDDADNWFQGNAGADIISGGGGNDTVSYGHGGTRGVVVNLSGTAQGGLLSGQAQDNWGAIDSLTGIENVQGSAYDDVVFGGAGANTIATGAGNDIVYGGGGNDSIDTGDGDDVIFTGSGNDTIRLGIGSNTVFDAGGNNTISAAASGGKDVVTITGAGNNTIWLGEGGDGLADGNDTVTVSDGDDLIHVGDGANLVTFGNGDKTIHAGSGDDIITAIGGGGNDSIFAGAGNDFIDGGSGLDRIDADDGDDTIVYNPTAQVDGGDGFDTLRFTGSQAVSLGTTLSNIEMLDLSYGSISLTATASILDAMTGDSHTLYILGGPDDTLSLGTGWSPTSSVNFMGRTFTGMTMDGLTLYVASSLRPNNAPQMDPVRVVASGATIPFAATDADVGDVLTYATTAPSHGEVVKTATGMVYVRDPDFIGIDQFDIVATDSAGATVTQHVIVASQPAVSPINGALAVPQDAVAITTPGEWSNIDTILVMPPPMWLGEGDPDTAMTMRVFVYLSAGADGAIGKLREGSTGEGQTLWQFEGTAEEINARLAQLQYKAPVNGDVMGVGDTIHVFMAHEVGVWEGEFDLSYVVPDTVFTGATSTDWNLAENWSDGMPDANLSAKVDGGKVVVGRYEDEYGNPRAAEAETLTLRSGTLEIEGTLVITSMTYGLRAAAGSTLILHQDATLEGPGIFDLAGTTTILGGAFGSGGVNSGTLTVSGGTADISGDFFLRGDFKVTGGRTTIAANISSDGYKLWQLGGEVVVAGTSGTLTLNLDVVADGGRFSVDAATGNYTTEFVRNLYITDTFDLTNSDSESSNHADVIVAGNIYNSGTLYVKGGDATVVHALETYAGMHNSGMVHVLRDLNFTGYLTNAGVISIADGKSLTMDATHASSVLINLEDGVINAAGDLSFMVNPPDDPELPKYLGFLQNSGTIKVDGTDYRTLTINGGVELDSKSRIELDLGDDGTDVIDFNYDGEVFLNGKIVVNSQVTSGLKYYTIATNMNGLGNHFAFDAASANNNLAVFTNESGAINACVKHVSADTTYRADEGKEETILGAIGYSNTIDNLGSHDVAYGGAEDDSFQVTASDFIMVDGKGGNNTLSLSDGLSYVEYGITTYVESSAGRIANINTLILEDRYLASVREYENIKLDLGVDTVRNANDDSSLEVLFDGGTNSADSAWLWFDQQNWELDADAATRTFVGTNSGDSTAMTFGTTDRYAGETLLTAVIDPWRFEVSAKHVTSDVSHACGDKVDYVFGADQYTNEISQIGIDDVIYGGSQNDLFIVDGAFALIDGGAGEDLLTFNRHEDDILYTLTQRLSGVERISLNSNTTGKVSLHLTTAEVHSATGHAIEIVGSNANDSVVLEGDWNAVTPGISYVSAAGDVVTVDGATVTIIPAQSTS